jgi:aryl-alcohol dehydrogenase-like predicted oxidoreductase
VRRKRLGASGLLVSVLGIGTMTFGSQVDEALAFRILDRAFDAGVNFFDTAEMYSSPSNAATYGRSEEILGRWAKTKNRDALVLATKLCGAADWPASAQMPHIRGGAYLLDRHHVESAVEASLRRLGVEYIDLYQSHWPDRNTPLDLQLEAMDRLVRAGKIRYWGVSNETPWGLTRLCATSQTSGCAPPVSIQNAYNLLQRHFELGLAEVCDREHVGMIAFSPLAMGLLSGKYGAARPADARLTLFARYGEMYLQEQMIQIAGAYAQVARDNALDPAECAFAWTTSRPAVATILTSVSRLEQLEPYLRSAEVALSPETLAALDRVRAQHDARWNMFG